MFAVGLANGVAALALGSKPEVDQEVAALSPCTPLSPGGRGERVLPVADREGRGAEVGEDVDTPGRCSWSSPPSGRPGARGSGAVCFTPVGRVSAVRQGLTGAELTPRRNRSAAKVVPAAAVRLVTVGHVQRGLDPCPRSGRGGSPAARPGGSGSTVGVEGQLGRRVERAIAVGRERAEEGPVRGDPIDRVLGGVGAVDRGDEHRLPCRRRLPSGRR